MVAYGIKPARLYMSPIKADLDNLVYYSDPLQLGESLLDFDYTFDSDGMGTIESVIKFVNPSLHFEDTLLQLYKLLYTEGRSNNSAIENIEDKTLTFYLRFGYGESEEDGLSRIMSCKLIDIDYTYASSNEKIIELTFTDNISFAEGRDPSHVGKSTVTKAEVSCFENGSLRKPGAVVSELISMYLSTFSDIAPIVKLYQGDGIGGAIDLYHALLTDGISGGKVYGSIAYDGLSEEVSVNLSEVSPPPMLPPGWGDVSIGTSPTQLHSLAAFQILLNSFGIDSSFGRTEVEASGVVDNRETNVGGARELVAPASWTMFNDMPVWETFPQAISDDVLDSAVMYSGTSYQNTVRTVLDDPNLSGIAFPSSSVKKSSVDGKYHLMFRNGGEVVPFSIASNIGAKVENTNLQVRGNTRKYYTLPSEGAWTVTYPESFLKSLNDYCNSLRAEFGSESTSEIDVVIEEAPKREPLSIGDIKGTANITKSVGETSHVKLSSIIEKINRELLPYFQKSDKELTMVQVPWSLLSPEERSKLEVVSDNGKSIVLVSSKESIREMYSLDTEQDFTRLALKSFPDLQVGNTLRLTQGYSDSIVTDIDFHQSILPAYTTSFLNYSLFKTIADAYTSSKDSGLVEVMYRDLQDTLTYDEVYFGISDLNTIARFTELRDANSPTDFINYYISWASERIQDNVNGEELIAAPMPQYAAAVANLADSQALLDIFGNDIEETYTYEYENGKMRVGSHSKFSTISINSKLLSFMSDLGATAVSDYERSVLHDFLYSEMAFTVNVTTLGIPEVCNPLLDMGDRGSRKVYLRVSEIRKPGESEHWLSGYYEILGYSHSINSSTGFTTRFRLARNPVVTRARNI